MIMFCDEQLRPITNITDVRVHVGQGMHWEKPPAVLISYRNEDDGQSMIRTKVIPCETEDEAYALAEQIRQEEGLNDDEEDHHSGSVFVGGLLIRRNGMW